jgi:hypothetical protein
MKIFPQSLVFKNYTKTTSKNQGTALGLDVSELSRLRTKNGFSVSELAKD